jgi:hypothetical protein
MNPSKNNERLLVGWPLIPVTCGPSPSHTHTVRPLPIVVCLVGGRPQNPKRHSPGNKRRSKGKGRGAKAAACCCCLVPALPLRLTQPNQRGGRRQAGRSENREPGSPPHTFHVGGCALFPMCISLSQSISQGAFGSQLLALSSSACAVLAQTASLHYELAEA